MKISNFDELIKDDLVLVDFYADWCGPCKMLSKEIDKINKDVIKIIKINVDSNQDLAKKYGVMTIPTLILFKNSNQIKKNIGYITYDDLIKWVNL